MPKELPPPELLRKLLRYDAQSGKLFWMNRSIDMFGSEKQPAEQNAKKWNVRYAGREAFTSHNFEGYRQGNIYSRHYLAHRVIWAIVHGDWPDDQIDHINGNKSDKRIENLRVVSSSENQRNQKMRSDNTSGAVGVCWNKASSKWHAKIKVGGKMRHIGLFADIKDAIAARKAAEKESGFHENHGRKR